MVRLQHWSISPETSVIRNILSEQEVHLTPRCMEVLRHFINNPGKVISNNELLDLFWSKSVRSDHAVHNVIAEIRAALGDKAGDPKFIKTFPKRGYALVAVPTVMANENGSVARPSPGQALRSIIGSRAGKLAVAITVTACLLVSLAITVGGLRRQDQASPDQRVLLLLPFENINVDGNTRYLSDQLPGRLVERMTTLPAAEVRVGLGNIDDSEAANYLLQGSIQQINDSLRLQVNLTDTENKILLFSDNYDFSSDSIFLVQDEIVQNVVSTLRIVLDESQKSDMHDWGTNNPLAYDAFLKAEFHALQSNHIDFRLALDNYLLAVEEDPDFLNAYLGLAKTATKMALYSHGEINVEMRRMVNLALREVIRLDQDADATKAMRILALRVEGNNQQLIESTLKNLILSGDAPDFAYSHYAILLMTVKLYDEAQHFLSLVSDDTPFKISPDATWSYRSKFETPSRLLTIKKQQLLERPAHVSVMAALSRSAAFQGDLQQANYYLQRQLELDEEGAYSMISQVIISALFGSSYPGGDAFEAANKNNPDFDLSFGFKSFILGDIDSGIDYWSSLTPVQIRRLFNFIDSIEIFFPDSVLADTRYLALLDDLAIGYQWQRHLMDSVRQMSAMTGIGLSEKSLFAYRTEQYMARNNLWDHQQIDYPRLGQLPEQRNNIAKVE